MSKDGCAHDDVYFDEKRNIEICSECKMIFEYCEPCSWASFSERNVYHAQPLCKSNEVW